LFLEGIAPRLLVEGLRKMVKIIRTAGNLRNREFWPLHNNMHNGFCTSTGLLKMIVRVLTTCHTQYT